MRGATCHRLIGNSFEQFLARIAGSEILNKEKLEDSFYSDLSNVWLGRIDSKTKKNCLFVDANFASLKEKYSYSSCCQNWTQGAKNVPGYSPEIKLDSSFASCYTPTGEFTYAVALGGFGIGISQESFSPYIGKYCNSEQKLICVQD